jgi:hypothetical protein
MNEAVDQEMRVAVERWARARGFTDGMQPWYTMFLDDGIRISRRLVDYKQRAEIGEPLYERARVSFHVALVWALAVEAELPSVDVGRCKRCRGRGEWSWWVTRQTAWPWWVKNRGVPGEVVAGESSPWPEGSRLRWERPEAQDPDDWVAIIAGPCPDCSGTGRDRRDAARLLLDAQPRAADGLERTVEAIIGRPPVQSVYPEAISAMIVLSDQLQPDLLRRADGPPRNIDREALGLHIAHLLAGSLEGTREAVEALRRATVARPPRRMRASH